MNHHTLHYYLAITHVPQIGMVRIQQLLNQFHSIEAIFSASPSALEKCKLNSEQINAIKNPNQRWIDEALQWQSEKHNHHILLWTDPLYPPLLTEIASAPAILFLKGDISTLTTPQIAIVGSRNPSHTGLEIAKEFAFELAHAGLSITSGLASGIDTAAHQGALLTGKTIAVLGSGLHQIYPKQNKILAEKISEKGCILSEFPINTMPARENFPRRNRIISGLSLGTLVVEAALKSGSLITARFAMEQNRDVFAIPGAIRNPVSQGCLSLIQQGAKCVTRVSDIMEELNIVITLKNSANTVQNGYGVQNRLDPTDNEVLACIENEITTIDQICSRSKLAAPLVQAALLRLELAGAVQTRYGGYCKQ